MIIDPDRFFDTVRGSLSMPERELQAWAGAFAILDVALAAVVPPPVIVMCGLPSSNMDIWAREADAIQPATILFLTAPPGCRQRLPIVQVAKRYGARISAVWFDVPLTIILRRNAERPADRALSEAALRAAFARFEPPTIADGFEVVDLVRPAI